MGAGVRAPNLRVAIDATPLIGSRSGVGHVTAGLLAELVAMPDVDVIPFGVTRAPATVLAGELPAGLEARTTRLPARALFALWRRRDRPRVERWTGRADVVHGTNFVVPPADAPQLVTVHDLTFLHSPELCRPEVRVSYRPLVEAAIRRGATIHVPSDFVGGEVRDAFGLGPERVRRIYFGVAPTAHGDAAAGRAAAGADRYLLALGTIEPRKNYPRLVRAFDALAARDPDVVLVIGGAEGWGVAELDATLAGLAHRDRVRRLGYVGERLRRDLLAGARALVFPSLYEGFGHPPLEAMGAGIPVVAATAGSLPEAVGDAALLVDPLDVDALAGALERILGDETLRADLVARGRQRVGRYHWSDSAREFRALYRELAALR